MSICTREEWRPRGLSLLIRAQLSACGKERLHLLVARQAEAPAEMLAVESGDRARPGSRLLEIEALEQAEQERAVIAVAAAGRVDHARHQIGRLVEGMPVLRVDPAALRAGGDDDQPRACLHQRLGGLRDVGLARV